MTEVGLPQALPSDPLPGILHFYHDADDDDDDDYNEPVNVIPGIFHFYPDDDDDGDDDAGSCLRHNMHNMLSVECKILGVKTFHLNGH